MKIFSILLTMAAISFTAQAKSNEQTETTASICHNQAIESAVMKNFKSFGASTSSCGIKPLQISEHLETFAVCTSDETDPMEYIVVVQKHFHSKKLVKKCVVQYIGNTYDAETPNFETDDGLIQQAQGCSIDHGDNKLVCNN